MSKEKLKKELHEMIDRSEDEEVLNMVKEDMEVYQKTETTFDDLSDLTPEQRSELKDSINENSGKDMVTEE